MGLVIIENKEFLHRIDQNGNILGRSYELKSTEMKTEYINYHPNNHIGNIKIEGPHRDEYWNYLYRVKSGKIIATINADLTDKIRTEKIVDLKSNFLNALNKLEQHEQKAKTLLLQWIIDGQSGITPKYWTDWKSERDKIDVNYKTKKTYLLALSRTIKQLKEYDTNL